MWPLQRVDKIFKNMDRDKDAKLTYDEFVEGSKQDPTIVQVRSIQNVFELSYSCMIVGSIAIRRLGMNRTSGLAPTSCRSP